MIEKIIELSNKEIVKNGNHISLLSENELYEVIELSAQLCEGDFTYEDVELAFNEMSRYKSSLNCEGFLETCENIGNSALQMSDGIMDGLEWAEDLI